MDYQAMLDFLVKIRDEKVDEVVFNDDGEDPEYVSECKEDIATINQIMDLVRNHRDGR